jgi:hypothetical protein
MAKYFNYFPKTYYTNSNTASTLDSVTNILSKFKFQSEFKNNSVVYYEYDISDGETPEMLAHKFYGSSEKHWIILALNDIVNPQMDWPLEQKSLINFIDKKYESIANTLSGQTGLEWATENIHSYYKIERRTNISLGTYIEEKIQIDANTYANVVSSTSNYTLSDNSVMKKDITKTLLTYLEYEFENNDSKRTIKILKPEFSGSVEQEFRRVING